MRLSKLAIVFLVTALVFSHFSAYYAGRASAFREVKEMIEQYLP